MIKFIIGFLVACAIWVIILSNIEMPEYKIFDCRISEFHPDYPAEVKEECRKKQNEQQKNQRHETTI